MIRRRRFALAAIFALLFAQVSLAAYACAAAVSAHVPAMSEKCPGHAPAAGDAVCSLHCDARVSLPATYTPDIAPVVSAILVVRMPAPADARTSFVPLSRRTAMATAPPAAIRFCRLLI